MRLLRLAALATALFLGCVSTKTSNPDAGGAPGLDAGPEGDAGTNDAGVPDGGAPAGPPRGIYVVNNVSGPNQPYDQALFLAPGYAQVSGHALFIPLSQLFRSIISQWPPNNFDWSYVNGLIRTATSNHRPYSVAFEVGSGLSLPDGFEAWCNPSGDAGTTCAPTFHIWTNSQKCLAMSVPLPWRPAVQQFWQALATSFAAELSADPTLGEPSLIHLPGLSAYDEEIRLPSGYPAPPLSSDCPQVSTDVAQWPGYGYSYANVAAGFAAVASAFANAFPRTELGLSLFNPLNGTHPQDFWPDPSVSPGQALSSHCPLTTDATTTSSSSSMVQCLVELVAGPQGLAKGRTLLQADDLSSDHLSASDWVLPEVLDQRSRLVALGTEAALGWQTNRDRGTGATCCGYSDGGTVCGDAGCDSETRASPAALEASPTSFFSLLREGWESAPGLPYGAQYLEVFSDDVVVFPTSLDAGTAPPFSFFPGQ
jgi:hypothetical protein